MKLAFEHNSGGSQQDMVPEFGTSGTNTEGHDAEID